MITLNRILCVNFFAQPAAGKSSSAFTIAGYLKNRGCNVDLVTEYAKEKVYRGDRLDNQIEIFSEQYTRQHTKQIGGVPMILTDSPLLLTHYYSQGQPYAAALNQLATDTFNTFENINVLVKRVKPYNPSGRYQTEAESDAMADAIANLLPEWDYEINGDEDSQKEFALVLLNKYWNRIKIKGINDQNS